MTIIHLKYKIKHLNLFFRDDLITCLSSNKEKTKPHKIPLLFKFNVTRVLLICLRSVQDNG